MQKTIRNLDPDQLKRYHRTILRNYIYGTNAIDGSQLSEAEVNALLTDEIVPKNRPNNDIWAVYDFTRLQKEDLSGPIYISMIKKIHKILTRNIIDRDGDKSSKSGEFRTAAVTISGSCHPVSRPDKIERDLAELLRWKENAKVDPIELTAIIHARFELIRPFLDFNGRVGRHILNLMLIREGLPAIYILPYSISKCASRSRFPSIIKISKECSTVCYYVRNRAFGPTKQNTPYNAQR